MPAHHNLSSRALAGIIVGSIVGGLILLGLLLFLCLWLRHRRRRSRQPPQATGDSSFGDNFDEDGEWQIVVPRSSGPSGGSAPSGEGHLRSSRQGSGDSRAVVAGGNDAQSEPGTDGSEYHEVPSARSSMFVAIPSSTRPASGGGQEIWTPWRRRSQLVYQDVPASEDLADTTVVVDALPVSPPASPRSVQYSDGHNSDAEQETLLDPVSPSAAFAVAGSPAAVSESASGSAVTKNRIVERAREAVAQRNARQRASYVPGAAGFFTWFRNSWTSSWRGPRTPGPSSDELGFRPPSEKSNPASQSSARRASQGPPASRRTHQSSEKSEKSVLASHHGSGDSPPTPHSSQFPTPPPTHLEAHALVRQRSRSTLDRQFRTTSAYSTGGASMGSGHTVYFDAMDAPPLPSPLSPYIFQAGSEHSLRLVPRATTHTDSPTSPAYGPLPDLTEFGELSSEGSELLPPPPLREIQTASPLSSLRLLGSIRSLPSSLRSVAYQADDVLDEPPPLPSASLDRRGNQPVPSSPPPSYSERRYPPPGLEHYHYQRMPAFDRSEESYDVRSETAGVRDILEEEPPSAGSQWRRIAGGEEPSPFEDRFTPVRVTTHFRRSMLENVRKV